MSLLAFGTNFDRLRWRLTDRSGSLEKEAERWEPRREQLQRTSTVPTKTPHVTLEAKESRATRDDAVEGHCKCPHYVADLDDADLDSLFDGRHEVGHHIIGTLQNCQTRWIHTECTHVQCSTVMVFVAHLPTDSCTPDDVT